jgi:hypothetical protein
MPLEYGISGFHGRKPVIASLSSLAGAKWGAGSQLKGHPAVADTSFMVQLYPLLFRIAQWGV